MTSSLADADALRRHDDQPIERQPLRLGLEPQDAIAKRVPVVVEELREHLAVGAHAADVARHVLRDIHQPAAVVAEIEHEVVHPRGRELGERAVERLVRRLHEIAEEHVADAAAAHVVDARQRHRRNRDQALHHVRLTARAAAVRRTRYPVSTPISEGPNAEPISPLAISAVTGGRRSRRSDRRATGPPRDAGLSGNTCSHAHLDIVRRVVDRPKPMNWLSE